MMKQIIKFGGFFAASVVVVPYTLAFITNLVHGWPLGKNKFKRAFSPTKVYALNVAIFKQLLDIKFAGLCFRWNSLYLQASPSRIIKNIVYGGNLKHAVDIYPPHNDKGIPLEREIKNGDFPVVVFIYGGTWSSGNKKMYPLLCTQLADKLQAVVCCPNYSTYPLGYVDDMVQDIVDCLKWIQQNIQEFGGDPNRIVLIGHSSGAHLISLVTLELVMKQLMEQPHTMIMDEIVDDVTPSMSASRQISYNGSGIQFNELYFNGNNVKESNNGDTDPLQFSQGATSSCGETSSNDILQNSGFSNASSYFIVGDGSNGSDLLQKSKEENIDKSSGDHMKGESNSDVISSSMLVVEGGGGDFVADEKKEGFETEQLEKRQEMKLIEKEKSATDAGDESDSNAEQPTELKRSESLDVEFDDDVTITSMQETDQNVSVVDEMSASMTEAKNLLQSIKLVIGLAGVYHIEEHYKFEYWRGVEDISAMARVMYGQQSFDRFSPTVLVQSLPRNTRLPAFHLIHGSHDSTVPTESSNKFCAALSHMGARYIYMSEIANCGHKELCLDLMDPKRKYHSSVLSEIIKSMQRFV